MNDICRYVRWLAGVVACVSVGMGCASTPAPAGFLSDYSRLNRDGGDLRYIDESRLGDYSEFIIDPVVVHFHEGAKGKDTDPDALEQHKSYLHGAIVSALGGSYSVVSQPGPGVARVRVAITDIRRDTAALNVLPPARMSGLGLGGASMEAELLDSQSGEQIAAVVQTQKGKRLSLEGFSQWSSAKAVMDGWAKRFRERLDAAHGG